MLEKGTAGTSVRVIGSVREMLFLGDERDRVLARLADPGVEIVSLTVTEKGYCHDPATGHSTGSTRTSLHDVANPASPVSTIGVLVRGTVGAPCGGRGCDHGRSAATIFRTTGAPSRASCVPTRRPSIPRSRSGSART